MRLVFIETIYEHNKHSIIGVIYKPPEINIDNFSINLNEIFYKINFENKYCKLMVDFNIDLIKVHNNNHINLDVILSYSFFPTISKQTRINESRATLTDHLYKLY